MTVIISLMTSSNANKNLSIGESHSADTLFGKTCISLGIFFGMYFVYISIDFNSQLEWAAVEISDVMILWVLAIKSVIFQLAVAQGIP